MARKVRKSTNTSPTDDAFVEAIKEALDNAGDNTWLGQHSPLATPYFLGSLLDDVPNADTPAGRGHALIGLLRDAVDAAERPQRDLLQLYYFDPHIRAKRNRAVSLSHTLFRSRQTILRDLRTAVQAVAGHVSQRALPPLRVESPVSRAVVGREAALSRAIAALRAGQSVAISGPGGIGKTSLAVALAERWGRSRVFWFTLRPDLSDRLTSLAYALGYFLRGLGAENTWRQLVAGGGKLPDEAILSGLIRHDLAQLADPPLLCIDDLEILRDEQQEHARLVRFVEGLRDHATLLLMGQRMPVDIREQHNHIALAGIDLDALDKLLVGDDAEALSQDERGQLLAATRGNPALIRLFLILHRAGEPVHDNLRKISSEPSAEALLNRVWLRLPTLEREVLSELSVFRGAAPRDAWSQPEAQAALDDLINRGLVAANVTGGVTVAQFAQAFAQSRLSADLRLTLHGAAALVRERRAEYTEAAWHLIEAGRAWHAVRLWAAHQVGEIARGHGATALQMFRAVPFSTLDDEDDRRMLSVILADLLIANGEAAEATSALEAVLWPTSHLLSTRARRLKGDGYELQDMLDQSAEAYQTALQVLARSPNVMPSHLHRRLGYLFGYRMGNMSDARREAIVACIESENFMGNVDEEVGNYTEGYQHYTNALELTHKLKDGLMHYRTCYSNLGRLMWRKGEPEIAIGYLLKAVECARQLNMVMAEVWDLNNLVGAYIIAGDHVKALETAEAGLEKAMPIGNAYAIAGLATNAGEACYYLGRYDDATRYALQALSSEEPPHRPYALAVLGLAEAGQGKLKEAERTLRLALESARENGDVYAEAAAQRALGDVHHAAGRPADARAAWEASLALYQRLGNPLEAASVQQRLAATP